MGGMNHNQQRALFLIVVAAALAGGWWLFTSSQRQGGMDAAADPGNGTNSNPPVAGVTPSGGSPAEELRHAVAGVRTNAGAAANKLLLAQLQAKLRSMPRDQSVAALRAQLSAGADAATGMGFKVGAGGALAEAPSWRVFLLEELARLDPAVAAEVARSILATKTSPEEWAVAMRNLARVQNDEAGRALLEAKMRELLTYEPWQRDPSVGFLEAFDVAVHLGGANLAPELSELLRRKDPEQRAVAHAAFLALDRLAIADPLPLLTKLTEAPTLMQGREATRAGYLARADVSEPAQRAVVERYLMDASRTAEELKSFVGIFPNGNFMFSENLLTTVATPDRPAQLARDQAALRVVKEWLADPRFASVRPTLEQMRTRLENFLRQASLPP